MSDGIFDGIFPIVHRTFLLSRGCWLVDFFWAQSMWTYNEAAMELVTAVFFFFFFFFFFLWLQKHGHEFRDEIITSGEGRVIEYG